MTGRWLIVRIFPPDKEPREFGMHQNKPGLLDTSWDGLTEFIWTEGNYGCDCNLGLFYHRECAGEEDSDLPCGETYKVQVTDTDGRVIVDTRELH